MDARGQTAPGCQEVNLATSHRVLQRTTKRPRAHTYTFFLLPAPLANVVLHISTEPPTHLKVLPEVKARGIKRRER